MPPDPELTYEQYHYRTVRRGIVAFGVAVPIVGVAFLASYLGWRWLYILAFVATGCYVLYVWSLLIRLVVFGLRRLFKK